MFRVLDKDFIVNHAGFKKSHLHQVFSETPIGFIDVGARGGAHDILEPVAACTAVLGFEPDKAECTRLLANPEVTEQWKKFELEPIALADKAGDATLYLLSSPTNHSILPPNDAFTNRYKMVKWKTVGTEALSAVPMDDVLFGKRKNEHMWGEIIKLDTQGSEYEILAGSLKTLRERTVAVVCEVAFCELYKGQKLFSDVEALMRKEGFSFYGFSSLHGRSQKLLNKKHSVTAERTLYSDAIFFKDPLPGGPRALSLSPRQIDVLFIAALLLNFYDFALELANETWLKKAGASEKEAITSLVHDLSQLPPEHTMHALDALLAQAKAKPELANICAGNFVDRRRRLCDYDDVLNISPLPKTL